MFETLELGSSPYEEDCVQVGTDNYSSLAIKECNIFKTLLIESYRKTHNSDLPNNVTLFIKSNAHDFGNYYEVAVKFDSDDELSSKAAYWFEDNIPARW